jgi:hypothetical protein
MKQIYKQVFFLLMVLITNVNLKAQDEPIRQWVASKSGSAAYKEDNKIVVKTATNDYYVVGNGGQDNFIYVIKYNSLGAQQSTFNYLYKSFYFTSVKGAHLDASNNLVLIGEASNSGNNIGYIAKFNTGNGSNTLLFESAYSIPNAGYGSIGVLKSIYSSPFVYVVGQESDTMWVSKINTISGSNVFVKKIKRYSAGVAGKITTYSNYVLRDVCIDNNKNLVFVGSLNSKSVNTLIVSPTVRRDDGFAFKLDSNGNAASFGSLAFPQMDNTSIIDTLGNSKDVATLVVTDISNNVYVAVELNDSINFNKRGLYLYKYSGGGTLAAGWPLYIGSVSNSNFKESGKFGGIRIVGSGLYVTFEKENYYKSPTINSAHKAGGVGIARIDLGTSTISWNNVLSSYSVSPGIFNSASHSQITMPLIDDLGSNLFYVYKRSSFIFLNSNYYLQIQKVNIVSGATTSFQYANSQGSANDVNVSSATVDGNGVPFIVGKAYYNSSRIYDGLMLKPNTTNTAVVFEDYYNQSASSYGGASNIGYFISNKPAVVGKTANLGSGEDMYFGVYDPATGSVTSATIDHNFENNELVDSKIYSNSSCYLLSTNTSGSEIFVDQVSSTASALQKLNDNISGTGFDPKFIDIHNNGIASNIYISGIGLGGDIAIRKYSLSAGISSLVDSVDVFGTNTYTNTIINNIVYNGNFAYATAFQNLTNIATPDRNIFERINLTTMTYSNWSTSSSVFSGLSNVACLDLQMNASKSLFTLVLGKDTTGGGNTFKVRLSKLDTNFNVAYNTNISNPNNKSMYQCKLVFHPTSGNPITVGVLSDYTIICNEYDLSTGALLSSNTYPNTYAFVVLNKAIISATKSSIYIAYSSYNSSYENKAHVSAIDFNTKSIQWNYTNPDLYSIINGLTVSPSGDRVYAAGNRPLSAAGGLGSELFIEKLCDINKPTLSTANISYCANNVGQILTTNYVSSLVWNTGQTTSGITPTSSGNYYNTYTASDACYKNSDTIAVTINGPINKEICFTSFDRNQNKILVYFDAFKNIGADSVIIYRDFGANNFQRVGSVSADSTWWQDNTIGTTISQALAYKIQIKDTCGQLGTLSYFHKPVFVTSFPNVVAGANTMNFEIYQRDNFPGGLPNKYFNLMGQNIITGQWDSVATIVAPTTPNQTSFQIVFTPSALQLSTYGSDYRIDAKLDTAAFTCTIANYAAKGVLFQAVKNKGGPSHSNLRAASSGLQNTLFNASILTYPNPSRNGVFNISSSTNEVLVYEVMNTSGKILKTGQFSKSTTLDLQTLSSGLYVLTISDGKNKIRQQLIK